MLESAARTFDSLPWAAMTVTGLLTLMPSILVHEVGHAIAALRLTDGPVLVKVGRPRSLIRFRVGRMLFGLHPLMSFGVPFAGFCAHAPASSRGRVVVIALAGPAASLFLAGAMGALALSASAGSTARAAFAFVAMLATIEVVHNLVPRTKTKGGMTVRSDGLVALDALRGPVFAIPEPPGGWLRGGRARSDTVGR